ncbi:hypothetical protein DM01DRAFT_1302217 [Hesseltinella vesiculosa]|uniref:Translation machinery-associated protein 16 n=1 Tax=Hesseltinella vesiculosa TaxID=101127 RepID=A0A1X2GP38_9FUNG|nr:hypothetical protein DM01DRAFT_1302217 [Hesseltinella vesiculosa]
MPNNKRHTLKTIKKRENLHPYSRKAQQLARIVMRKDKIGSKVNSKKDNIANRWLWFRYSLDDGVAYTDEKGMHELVQLYLKRHDDELAELRAQRQKTKRPKSQREHLLEATLTSEKDEYRSGMDLPDMTIRKSLEVLRQWDGDSNGMDKIRTIRLHMPSEHDKKENSGMAIDTNPDDMDTK